MKKSRIVVDLFSLPFFIYLSIIRMRTLAGHKEFFHEK